MPSVQRSVQKLIGRKLQAVKDMPLEERAKLLQDTLKKVKIPKRVVVQIVKTHASVCPKKHSPIKCMLSRFQKEGVHGGMDIPDLILVLDSIVTILLVIVLVTATISSATQSSESVRGTTNKLWNIFTYGACVMIFLNILLFAVIVSSHS